MDWTSIWERRLEEYLKSVPRAGYFIKKYFGKSVSSILEVGGGSCKDSIYLANNGFSCICSDKNKYVIEILKKKFNEKNKNIIFDIQDALNLTYKENSFDLVFSNGLIIYFYDNREVIKILEEKCRVAKKFVITIVHNKHNKRLVKKFKTLAEKDELYNIRFYSIDELINIAENLKYNKKIKKYYIMKFGGIFDLIYYALARIFGKDNEIIDFFGNIVPLLYRIQPISLTERLALIIEIGD